MTIYTDLISKATGLSDPDKIQQVEGYMRHIYFHSTLNWQTERQLLKAAKQSAKELEMIGWDFK